MAIGIPVGRNLIEQKAFTIHDYLRNIGYSSAGRQNYSCSTNKQWLEELKMAIFLAQYKISKGAESAEAIHKLPKIINQN